MPLKVKINVALREKFRQKIGSERVKAPLLFRYFVMRSSLCRREIFVMSPRNNENTIHNCVNLVHIC